MCPSHSSDYQKLFMQNLTGNSCKQPTGKLANWQTGKLATGDAWLIKIKPQANNVNCNCN